MTTTKNPVAGCVLAIGVVEIFDWLLPVVCAAALVVTGGWVPVVCAAALVVTGGCVPVVVLAPPPQADSASTAARNDVVADTVSL